MILLRKFFLFFICLLSPSLTFAAPGALSGVVVSEDGAPIYGATIKLGIDNIDIYVTTTTPDGIYSIPGVPAGTYGVIAIATGFQSSNTELTMINNTSTELNFILKANPATVSGTIYSGATGLPIPNASLNFFFNSQFNISGTNANSSGEYTLSGLEPGNYQISAFASGYQVTSIGKVLTAGETYTGVNLTLPLAPGKIIGDITSSATSNPIQNASITFSLTGKAILSTATYGTGSYSKDNLAVGNYVVTASSEGYITKSASVDVLSGATETQDFALDPLPGTVAGKVTDQNKTPINDAQIDIFVGSVSIAQGISSLDGSYSVGGLAPGTYIIVTSKTGYESYAQSVTVTANQLTLLNIQLKGSGGFGDGSGSELTGTVTDLNTSDPLSGAAISVFLGTTLVNSALTDNSGYYSISNLPENTYTIIASKDLYVTQTKSATIKTNATLLMNFALDNNAGSVSGTVLESGTSDPIPMANVIVTQNGNIIAWGFATDSGSYSISGLAAGTYSIQASATGYETVVVETIVITSGGSAVQNFLLDATSNTVTGIITDAATGAIIPAAYVQLIAEGSNLLQTIFTDSNGSYNFLGLFPGTYSVLAKADGFISSMSPTFTITSSISLDDIVQDLSLYPVNQDLVASVIINKFVLQNDRIHRLTWTGNTENNLVQYSIQRDEVIIGYVPATAGTLVFDDHDRSPIKTDQYIITAIDSEGRETAGAPIYLR